MNLSMEMFIRRFSLHILPARFTRIRHYAILPSRLKYILFEQIIQPEKKAWDELWEQQDVHVYTCPQCNKGTLILLYEIPKREPPIAKFSVI